MSELTLKKKKKSYWAEKSLPITNSFVFVSQTKVTETPAENPAPVTEQSGAE